jgi:nitroreductase
MDASTPSSAGELTARLRERYGERAPGAGHAAPPLLELLLAHRSVRAYLDEPLDAGVVETMVAAAQSAATSSNLQAWSVVAVEDRERKARLAEFANSQAHVRAAPLLLVWLADLSRLDRTATRVGRVSDANRYLEMFLVAAIDAALAAQNAVLAAEAMGLGTCYIGAMRNHPERVAAELCLPPRVFPVFGLTVGRPDPARPASVKPRLPQTAVLHHETYRADHDAEAAAVDGYDALIQRFQRGQAMTPTPWSRQASERVAGPGSLSGRHRLVEAIRALGFELD